MGVFAAFVALASVTTVLSTRAHSEARRGSLRRWCREKHGRFTEGSPGWLDSSGTRATVRLEGIPVRVDVQPLDGRHVVRARARFAMGCGPRGRGEPPMLDAAMFDPVFGTTEDTRVLLRMVSRYEWSEGAAEWRAHVLAELARLETAMLSAPGLTTPVLSSDGEHVEMTHALAPRSNDVAELAEPLALAVARLARFGLSRASVFGDLLGTSVVLVERGDERVEPCARLGRVELAFSLASDTKFRLVTRATVPTRTSFTYAGSHGVLGLDPPLPPSLASLPALGLLEGIGACQVTLTPGESACLVWVDEQDEDVLRAGAAFLEALVAPGPSTGAFR